MNRKMRQHAIEPWDPTTRTVNRVRGGGGGGERIDSAEYHQAATTFVNSSKDFFRKVAERET